MKHNANEEKGEPKDTDTAAEEKAEGVVVPEDFQQDVHSVLQKAKTKHHLSHIRDRVYQKEDEMRKAEMAKKPNKKGKGPDEFSTDGAPGDVAY